MIRINLIPQKRRAEARQGGQAWLAVVLALLLAEVAALFIFHGLKVEELDAQNRKNTELRTQIDQAKAAVKMHPEVKAKLEKLRAREEAIAKLQSARTGPTAVILELSRILTPGRGPQVDPDVLTKLRHENPLALHNSSWDARRLWLTSFAEHDRKVQLEGLARDGEDVSELAKRMNLSNHFHSVRLLPAKRERDKESGLDLVHFKLEAGVKY